MNFFKRLFGIKDKEEESGVPQPLNPQQEKHRSTSIDDVMDAGHSSPIVEEALRQNSQVEKTSAEEMAIPIEKKETHGHKSSGGFPPVIRKGNIPLNANPDEWFNFEKDGKEGYEDENENMMIDAQFDEADIFEHGVATVKIGEKQGMINGKGEWVLPPEYDFIYGVTEGMIHIEKDGLVGFAEPDGKIKIKLQYGYASEFSEGWAVASNEDYMKGYIDKDNKTMLPFKFSDAGQFKDGLAYARPEGGDYGYINKSGNFVIEPQFERAGDFSEGLAPVRINEKYTWCDKSGKTICAPTYHAAELFTCGLASVQKEDKGKWGMADRTGQLVFDYQFDYAVDFMDDKTAYVFINKKCLTLHPDGTLMDDNERFGKAKTP